MLDNKTILILSVCLACVQTQAQDAHTIEQVAVYGKGPTQRLKEGAFAVGAVHISDALKSSTIDLNRIIGRAAGVNLRTEGGAGSEFDLSIGGLSGNSVRWMVDGVPLIGVSAEAIPTAGVERVEIYKGVVPSSLGADALGGVVNIVTRKSAKNHLDFSYAVGSFHTHRVALEAQLTHKKIIFRPSLSVDRSRNDYLMRGVEVWDEASRQYRQVDRRRFHDGYRSTLARLEIGVKGKEWADEFFVSGSFSATDKQVQTGSVQSKVVGAAERYGNATSAALRYSKQLGQRLRLAASAAHTWDRAKTVDTTQRIYDWNGAWIASSRNELTGRAPSLRHFRRPTTIARAAAQYRLNDRHALDANYLLTRTGNGRWDDVDAGFAPSRDAVAKHILALGYNQNLRRLVNSFFIKQYVNHLTIRQTDIPTITGSRTTAGRSTKTFTGFGAASRYAISPQIAFKASYEHATRLPSARELLGNGTTVYANVALKPERSDNLNLGLFGTVHPAPGHTLYYEAGGFLRLVDDFIQARVSEREGTMQYVNVAAVHIKGIEAEVRYSWLDRLSVMANATWLDARDRARLKTDGTPSATFRNRVPNQPWLLGGVEADYSLGRLRLGASWRWVHWYFLTWEAYGLAASKARIPSQHILDLRAIYTWSRYSVAAECANLFDETAYDNYKLQKPGRSFSAKITISL